LFKKVEIKDLIY